MRHFSIAVLMALAMALLTEGAEAAGDQSRTIAVSGTAVTRVAPDVIAWNLSVAVRNRELAQAKQESDATMQKILGLIDELAVKPEDVQTGHLSIRKVYERDERGNETDVFKHFDVRRSISFRQRDLSRFDEFLARLVGATEFEASYNFETSKLEEIRFDTRLKAAIIAREKAKALCETLGTVLGQVITIEEFKPQAMPYGMGGGMMSNVAFTYPEASTRADASTGTLAPGAVEVRETVDVTFAIE